MVLDRLRGGFGLRRHVPFVIQGGEDGDKYYFGYPLLPGEYFFSIAVTTKDLKQIGTNSYTISVSDPNRYQLEIPWVLFVNKIERMPDRSNICYISIFRTVLAAALTMFIALLTINFHTIRAASSNPVDSLRYG